MSYESAPQTQLVASTCIVCSRPLCDAKSAELGIGPVCRKRHGYDEASVSEDARQAANLLLNKMARGVGNFASQMQELFALGFEALHAKIGAKQTTVQIHKNDDGSVFVVTPYNPAWVQVARTIKAGRRGFQDHPVHGKGWNVRPTRRLLQGLERCFPNTWAMSYKVGIFALGNPPVQDDRADEVDPRLTDETTDGEMPMKSHYVPQNDRNTGFGFADSGMPRPVPGARADGNGSEADWDGSELEADAAGERNDWDGVGDPEEYWNDRIFKTIMIHAHNQAEADHPIHDHPGNAEKQVAQIDRVRKAVYENWGL